MSRHQKHHGEIILGLLKSHQWIYGGTLQKESGAGDLQARLGALKQDWIIESRTSDLGSYRDYRLVGPRTTRPGRTTLHIKVPDLNPSEVQDLEGRIQALVKNWTKENREPDWFSFMFGGVA